jgi:hypothetical protein
MFRLFGTTLKGSTIKEIFFTIANDPIVVSYTVIMMK